MCADQAVACSRVLYKGLDSTFVVGRSLDWKTPIPTSLYVYPRGIAKKGSDKPGAVEWTSKYGAVYSVSYDSGITEGMNEMGLLTFSCSRLLRLCESKMDGPDSYELYDLATTDTLAHTTGLYSYPKKPRENTQNKYTEPTG